MARHGLVLAALLVSGCGWLERNEASPAETENRLAEKREHHEACASAQTGERLKALAFDEAARVGGGDSSLFDDVAERATARMEDAAVLSRDDELNVTTCSGRLVLELPAGVAGERRVAAEIRYAAQSAADGSGMVYQMEGAEPLIHRLALGGGANARALPVTVPQASAPPGAPRQTVAPAREGEPPVKAAPPAAEPQAAANPSFNCRSARTRSERRVCASPGLAARDRQMSAIFYSALANADAATRRRLRSSRDRFLAFRERCSTDACIAQAYADRIDEIEDIAAAGE
ncbi:MAG: lysozyme inhibitor LprI family protein [Allosphingosinicella sp.]|uniref:lysozyme inhibitor LprI family protein n=1 Tax=Allosphingosinicella sp. TaxID=2823234 RepID=UPI003955B197